MSNKIVPQVYRSVIDEVIAAIKPEFDEYGVGEEVLADLQHKWQQKVIASGVAEFEPQQPQHHPPPQHHYPPHAHPLHMLQAHPHYTPAHNPYALPSMPGQPAVKAEPMDPRFALLSGLPYALPTLAGPSLPGPPRPNAMGASQTVLSFPQPGRPLATPPHAARPTVQSQPQSSSQGRIPQVDGPSSSGSDGSPEPAYAPRASHPSLPQPSQTSTVSAVDDAEAINSDLDDSDEDEADEEEAAGAMMKDIVFCTYDKVARVRNKWKCVLKDGTIHVNNKDYLFSKCTGEFEW